MALAENFTGPSLDARLQWYNPPTTWRIEPATEPEHAGEGRLVLFTDSKTDYWQRTHYNFRVDNGPFLFVPVTGDFILSTRVTFHPKHQYDQAGLMVRISPSCWLKTSVEFEPHGFSHLGCVITNSGYSDWSTQEVPSSLTEISLRVRRETCDYIVEFANNATGDAERWCQLRMARLLEDDNVHPVDAGLYACSPKDAGYSASFHYINIKPGRV